MSIITSTQDLSKHTYRLKYQPSHYAECFKSSISQIITAYFNKYTSFHKLKLIIVSAAREVRLPRKK